MTKPFVQRSSQGVAQRLPGWGPQKDQRQECQGETPVTLSRLHAGGSLDVEDPSLISCPLKFGLTSNHSSDVTLLSQANDSLPCMHSTHWSDRIGTHPATCGMSPRRGPPCLLAWHPCAWRGPSLGQALVALSRTLQKMCSCPPSHLKAWGGEAVTPRAGIPQGQDPD